MADFSALVARSETIELAGIQITVRALSVASLGTLIARYQPLWGALKDGDFLGAIQSAGPRAIADVIVEATRGEIPREVALEIDPLYAGLIITTVIDLTLVRLEQDPNLGNLAARHLAGLKEKIDAAVGSSTSSPS